MAERANRYVICTGAGAGLFDSIWKKPGCSAYFEGGEFPYGTDAQDALFGFKPASYVDEDAAIRYAMVAYQKAWKPGRKAMGLGLTAVAAGLKVHRGDHRIHAAVMSDHGCWVKTHVLEKKAGADARVIDGFAATVIGKGMLQAIDEDWPGEGPRGTPAMERARELFFDRPFIDVDGSRCLDMPKGPRPAAIYPGAFNPPHHGHHGIADEMELTHRVVFNVDATAPNKAPLSVQELLQRAKMLRGRRVLFTRDAPLYVDKVKKLRAPIIMGADALNRMLDPKWGHAVGPMLFELSQLGASFYVCSRTGSPNLGDSLDLAGVPCELQSMFFELKGHWGISSSELRKEK